MAKVYIFAGFVVVILAAVTYVMVLSRVGLGMFRFRKKEKGTNDQAPAAGVGRDRDSGPGGPHWV